MQNLIITIPRGALIGCTLPSCQHTLSYLIKPRASFQASEVPMATLGEAIRNDMQRLASCDAFVAYTDYVKSLLPRQKGVPKTLAIDYETASLHWINIHGTCYDSLDQFRYGAFLGKGLYAAQLLHWFSLYSPSPERWKIVRSEDMFASPLKTLASVANWLGLAEFDFSSSTQHVYNQSTQEPADAELQSVVRAFLEPHNRLLTALLCSNHLIPSCDPWW